MRITFVDRWDIWIPKGSYVVVPYAQITLRRLLLSLKTTPSERNVGDWLFIERKLARLFKVDWVFQSVARTFWIVDIENALWFGKFLQILISRRDIGVDRKLFHLKCERDRCSLVFTRIGYADLATAQRDDFLADEEACSYPSIGYLFVWIVQDCIELLQFFLSFRLI